MDIGHRSSCKPCMEILNFRRDANNFWHRTFPSLRHISDIETCPLLITLPLCLTSRVTTNSELVSAAPGCQWFPVVSCRRSSYILHAYRLWNSSGL